MEHINKAPDADASKLVKTGLTVITIIFVLLGGWISFAPLAIYSVATGKVSADFNKKRVQHMEGGIIKTIFVKDGDFVKKDQLLIKLDDKQIKAELETLKSKYENLIVLEARLLAQKNDLKKMIIKEKIENKEIIKEQKFLFFATLESIQKNKQIIDEQISQLKNQIEGINFTLKSKEFMQASIKEEIKELEVLYAKKLINKVELRKLQRENAQLTGDITSSKQEKIKLRNRIQELKAKRILIDKDFKKETLEKLTSTSSKISEIKLKIDALQDKLNKTNIYSPADGYVVGIADYRQDSIIKASSDILEIVPKDNNLLVVGQVKSTDIDKIKVGLDANIIFSAFNTKKSHSIKAKIVYVSADSFIDEESNELFYEVKAKLNDKGMEQIKLYNFNLISGMPAEMMINTGSRTVLSYLVKPLVDRFNRSFNEE